MRTLWLLAVLRKAPAPSLTVVAVTEAEIVRRIRLPSLGIAMILLTVALFIAAIRVLRIEFLPSMVSYAATYVAYWAALGTNYPWMESVSTESGAGSNE